MTEFRPNVAVLPSHSMLPSHEDLEPYAAVLERQGATPIVPEMPENIFEEFGSWGSMCESLLSWHITELDELHQRMDGAHAVLFVNTGAESTFVGHGYSRVDRSMSYVMLAAARSVALGGVPIAMTHKPEWDGRDDDYWTIGLRMEEIHHLGATVVGDDLAGMPDFLSGRVCPDVAIHGGVRPRNTPLGSIRT